MAFHKGDRVKLVDDYLVRTGLTKKNLDRLGTVSGEPNNDRGLVGVIWDGAKTPERYHATFLQKASSTASASASLGHPLSE